jgi:nucleoside-diphosphate-sugar epimerase
VNVAVFGASGFLGYNFIRHLLHSVPEIKPTAFSTNAGSLVNLSRHDIDIRLVSYAQLPLVELDSDTDYLVNFSHPFAIRENMTVGQQIRALLQLFHGQLVSHPNLKLIHISSMSVYEPFDGVHELTEDCSISPPRSDFYARNKAEIDREILSWETFSHRILLLRPTVVYGPFGRPWTDNIIRQFLAGPVHHMGLKGAIQPIWVGDISRFILANLREFAPGIYNLAGPETITWKTFLAFFEDIVKGGTLTELPAELVNENRKRRSLWNSCKNALSRTIRHPTFKELATPVWRRLPDSIKQGLKQNVLGPLKHGSAASGQPMSEPFWKQFFEEDRLVSADKFHREYPDFSLTRMDEVQDTMNSYFRFRFSNGLFW